MICIPVREKTSEKFYKAFMSAQKEADIVELWFDELKKLDDSLLNKLFKQKKKPILYKSSGDSEKLQKILNFPVDYIDLDLKSKRRLFKLAKNANPTIKLIISHHDFDSTPSLKKLQSLSKKMLRKGADIVKIACKANSIVDSLKMLAFIESQTEQKQKCIGICMGKEGQITRLAGHLFGNYLMYAPLSEKDATAPGQVTFKELQKVHSLKK